MNRPSDAGFEANVSAWNDAYLRSQYAAGPAAFQPAHWQVIDAEFSKRGLQPMDASEPVGPVPAATPWFLVSRLSGTTWPTNVDLPMTYVKFAVVVGALYAIAYAAGLVKALGDYFGYHLYPGDARFPVIELINAAWAALLAFALASRRPWGWYYAMVAMGLATMTFFVNGASSGVAALIWFGLMWLYLARRRRQFGLSSWPFVM